MNFCFYSFGFGLITYIVLCYFREDDNHNHDSTCSVEVIGLGTLVQDMWLCWEPLLCHNLEVIAWALSILPKICCNVNDRLDGEKKAAMERGVKILHLLPSQNKQVAGKNIETIFEIFWKEF